MSKLAIRSMVCAPKDHYLLSVDLSQAEAWIVAYSANDPNMKAALNGGDIHSMTARVILDKDDFYKPSDQERYTGKKCNHAFNFRMKEYRAAQVINAEGIITVTVSETKIFRKKYLEFYQIQSWWASIDEQLGINRTLVTPYGRERTFYAAWGEELSKEATAFIPQSTIADHMFGKVQPEMGIKGGIKEVYHKLVNKNIKMINTSHDSLILEVHNSIDIMTLASEVKSYIARPMMVNGEIFTIPCDFEVGERWYEMEKLKVA